MRYWRKKKFIKAYRALPPEIKEKVRKAFELFKQDPKHPSLHTKKIKGIKGQDVFEGRIDKSYRFTFHYDGDEVVFRNIGPHDIVDEEADQD
jgi:mRNA interferase RelE/StbE